MGLFKVAGVNRRLFFILFVAAIFANIAVLPYAFSLAFMRTTELPVQLPVAVLVQITQAVVFFAAAIFIGLFLGRKVGLGVPLLEAWLKAEPAKDQFISILKISILLGVLIGVSLFILDRYIFAIFIEPVTAAQAEPPVWQRFLVSFYGGIGEEIGMRLFLMTLLVWISSKIKKTHAGSPTNLGFWSAIILISVVFGLSHLPMTAKFQEITTLVVIRAVLLNGIAGVVFGWLFWKKGLESAMISHFSTDIALHVILPAIL